MRRRRARHGYERIYMSALFPTIFHEDWWLQIATGGRYGIVETKHNGALVGYMPYAVTERFGSRSIEMPTLTHFQGPVIDDGQGSANSRTLRRFDVTSDLIRKLPKVGHFFQKFHRNIDDVLAFQTEGYDAAVQFNHEIKPQPTAVIWRGMRDKTRNMVRKADRTYTIEVLTDPDEFVAFYTKNLTIRDRRNYLDTVVCRSLVTAALSRGRGRIYAARDASGDIAAAIFCVWDQTSSYYLMSTRRADSGNSPNTLLLWQAISDAAERGLIFDFDGLSSSGAIPFYAGFGAEVKPRYTASRTIGLRRIVRALRGRGLHPQFR